MAFYANGWTGITIEPDPQFAALLRQCRPGDLVVEAAITTRDHDSVVLHVVDGTGLSTLDAATAQVHASLSHETHDLTVPTRTLDSILDDAGWAGQDIHFMSVDTEGSERDVLESIDLSRWRPWVLVVEATEPNSTRSTRHLWEDRIIEAGYRFCLFDGLSCFFVAASATPSWATRSAIRLASSTTTRRWRFARAGSRPRRPGSWPSSGGRGAVRDRCSWSAGGPRP